jgi:hypothetical protein
MPEGTRPGGPASSRHELALAGVEPAVLFEVLPAEPPHFRQPRVVGAAVRRARRLVELRTQERPERAGAILRVLQRGREPVPGVAPLPLLGHEPASLSMPRCRETPDWAMPRMPVSSVTFRRSACSSRRIRRRASSPSRRNSGCRVPYTSIYMNVCLLASPARCGILTARCGAGCCHTRPDGTPALSVQGRRRCGARARRRAQGQPARSWCRLRAGWRRAASRRPRSTSLHGQRPEGARSGGGPRGAWRDAVEPARTAFPDLPLFIGGKSWAGASPRTSRLQGCDRLAGSSSSAIRCTRPAGRTSAATHICLDRRADAVRAGDARHLRHGRRDQGAPRPAAGARRCTRSPAATTRSRWPAAARPAPMAVLAQVLDAVDSWTWVSVARTTDFCRVFPFPLFAFGRHRPSALRPFARDFRVRPVEL